MLTYNHIFNENLDYFFHVHIIESNSASVSIKVNGIFIGNFKPTLGSTYSFNKYYEVPDILDLIIVGSRQTYSRKINNSYFKESTIRYVKNTAGEFLCIDPDTEQYYWSTTSRNNFYFNPEYFSSKTLWEMTIGYMPTGKEALNILSNEQMFYNRVYETTRNWPGQRPIQDVDPIEEDYFSNLTTGSTKEFKVDYFIDELQGLNDDDEIEISNGIDTINVIVKNIYTTATYPVSTVTTRPITHVEIDIVNPNKKCLYSKAQEIDEVEDINLTLYGNDINFTIAREAEPDG